jgi:hypothetical protein
MIDLCQEHGLLSNDNNIIRVPFLIKGELIIPPTLSREEIINAFEAEEDSTYYKKLAHAQLTREPIIERSTMTLASDYLYRVLPPIDPYDLIETDFNELVRGPYSLSIEAILEYLELITETFRANRALIEQVRDMSRLTSMHPDLFLDIAFETLTIGLDNQSALNMIENELSLWGHPGSDFLRGWVEVPSTVIPGIAPLVAHSFNNPQDPNNGEGKTFIRAMPTRQLHITAGNAPQIPLISALRVFLTKSAGVIKSPFEAMMPGALLALAAVVSAKDHPLTRHLSLVYWSGGDEKIESHLLMPNAFDRIVVWGSPEAVASVQNRATFTNTISFNPRYGVSMIGKEAFKEDIGGVVFKAATDTMIYNQKACASSQVHYLEASDEEIADYAERLVEILSQWDSEAPQFIPPSKQGQIKRMKRGKYNQAEWVTNTEDGAFRSGVVIMPGEFDILDHPMSRLVVIRQVNDLNDALKYLHQGVSTVGVYPEERRIFLRDQISARGVSNVLPLGQCERLFPGAPHDGMIVLSQLVDWKNG